MYLTPRGQVLDATGDGSAAVRLALGETQLVSETRQFLEQQGVRLDAFNRPAGERSNTVILAKNLPAHTDPAQLRDMFSRHGELGRVVLPPSGVTGQWQAGAQVRAGGTSQCYPVFDVT